MRLDAFNVTAIVIALLGAAVTIFDLLPVNKFYFFAGYVVLQYVVLATAWNIMGGYMGYVNFGTAGFFAVGAYTSVVLYNLMKAPLLLMIPVSGAVCALLGLGMGYLTLRLRGVFFAIATLAMAIVLETLVVNWDYVGGATGAYILRAREIAPFGDYVEFLFFVMLLLAIFAVAVARWIERSRIGRGFGAIRDDEVAAECAGVPTLRLKLVATTVSGFLMGVAGAPFVLYVGLRRALVRVQPRLRRQLDRDADDRRRDHLARTPHRRPAPRLGPAGRDRHHLVGAQPPHRRRAARVLRDRGPRRDHRTGPQVAGGRPMTGEQLLEVRSVTKRFGGFVALDEVSLVVGTGERFGLIGPNGSGKTTLINCISGTLANDGGEIVFKEGVLDGKKPHERTRLGISRSFQIPKPFRSMTVLENLAIPLEYASGAGPGEVEERGMAILETIGLAERAGENSGKLTQIDMRKLELARAMATEPELLISDEAMAGLSSTEVDDILEILFRMNERGITIIMIEHIMRAVMRFSERIVVLDAGRKIAEGNPDEIVNDPEVERAYLGE